MGERGSIGLLVVSLSAQCSERQTITVANLAISSLALSKFNVSWHLATIKSVLFLFLSAFLYLLSSVYVLMTIYLFLKVYLVTFTESRSWHLWSGGRGCKKALSLVVALMKRWGKLLASGNM